MSGKNLDPMNAMALTNWINKGGLYDTVFTEQGMYGMNPYLDWLTSSGGFDKASNDKNFGVTLSTARNNNFAYVKPYGTWKTLPVGGYTQAQFQSKESVMSWSICAPEVYYNGSNCEKMFDRADHIRETTTKSLKEEFNARLISKKSELALSNPGGSPDQAFCDLETIIGDELSDVKVFGGIDATDCHFWRSLIKRPGYGLPRDPRRATGWVRPTDSNVIAGGAHAGWQALKLNDLNTMIRLLQNCEANGYVAFTTPEIMDVLEYLIRSESGSMPMPLCGKLKVCDYTGVNYRGVDFMSDLTIPEGKIYFVHAKHIRFRPVAGRFMTAKAESSPINQDAVYGAIHLWGEHYSASRQCLGAFEHVAAK